MTKERQGLKLIKSPKFTVWVLTVLLYSISNHKNLVNAVIPHGHKCNSTELDSCVLNTSCVQAKNNIHRCLCSAGFYYRNSTGKCEADSNWEIIDMKVKKVGLYGLQIKWSPINDNLARCELHLNDELKKQMDCSTSESNLELLPGTNNNVTICSEMRLPEYYENSLVQSCNFSTVCTKPTKPGPITSISPSQEAGYNITFIASAGNVERYAININGSQHNYTKVYSYTKTAENVSDVTLHSRRNSETGKIDLIIEWTPGAYTGHTLYNIILKKETSYESNIFETVKTEEAFPNTSFVESGVQAYWYYKASVQANTSEGSSGWVQSASELTEENYPELVQYLNVAYENNTNNFMVMFDCLNKSQSNGIIKRYMMNLTLFSTAGDVENTESHEVECNKSNILEAAIAERNYTFAVMAMNQNYPGNFSDPKFITVPPRKPKLSKKYNISHLLKLPKVPMNEQNVADIEVCASCLVDSVDGKVVNAGLIVCVDDGHGHCKAKNDTNSNVSFQDFITYKKAKESYFSKPYRTTPDDWLIKEANQPSQIHFMVGEDRQCEVEYCNGVLPEGKIVFISVIVCTNGGCDQQQSNDSFNTRNLAAPLSNKDTTAAIVLSILAVVIVLCLVVVFLCRKMATQKLTWLPWPKTPGEPEIRQYRPIKIREFEEHVKRFHKDSNLLFQDEFEDIRKLCMTFRNSCNEAQREANRIKNRYVDILPYDHSRVRMDVQPEDEETNDFINANYISGYNSVREYIATQGPMHYTISDFWRMAWEQKCQIIVMLSDLQESGKLKVDQYWPDGLNEAVHYENVVVEMTNLSQLNKYIIRNFRITKGEESRKMTQFFLSGWWDFSANLSFDDVLEFVKFVRQEITPETTGPAIVHCSAGVGRTGTFIALDYFMQYIDQHTLDDEVDIFDFVLKMRKNRPRMVQAESQYIFIFDAVLEMIKKKVKAQEERQLENNGTINTGEQNADGEKKSETIVNIPMKDDSCIYTNEAFEPEHPNTGASEKEEKPVTEP